MDTPTKIGYILFQATTQC